MLDRVDLVPRSVLLVEMYARQGRVDQFVRMVDIVMVVVYLVMMVVLQDARVFQVDLLHPADDSVSGTMVV